MSNGSKTGRDWGAQLDDPDHKIPIAWFREIKAALGAPDIIEDTLGKGAMSVVYGESNSGKTFFTCTMALHVACGWSWFGLETEKVGVIYVALEGTHGIMNRITAFKIEHGLMDEDIPFGLVTIPLDLCRSEEDTPEIISRIKAAGKELGIPIGLIVMDTLARAMGNGNENGPEDMGALVRNGDKIRSETGAHVLWVHHSGKDQALGARGHSSLRAATDTEIEVTAEDKVHVARVTKQRDFDCEGEFTFTLKVVPVGENARGKIVRSCVLVADEPDAPGRRPRLRGHQKKAYELLENMVAHKGLSGMSDVPSGYLSIPEDWWRDNFYERAMPGAVQGTKQKAFRRAADDLIEARHVGMAGGRVWCV